MTLGEFASESPNAIREPVIVDDSVMCPVDRTVVDGTHGDVPVATEHVVDDDLRKLLERNGVETLTGLGWLCTGHDLTLVETCSGRDAPEFTSRWIGVKVEPSVGGSLWVPVVGDDLPDVVDVIGDDRSDDVVDDDPGTEPRPLPISLDDVPRRVDVGHVSESTVDVYAGRGAGGDLSLANAPEPLVDGWLGNPFPLDDWSRDESLSLFTDLLFEHVETRPEFRAALVDLSVGRATLGCYCHSLADDSPRCHGDVVATVADLLAYRFRDDPDAARAFGGDGR